jgi:hypothetical protein
MSFWEDKMKINPIRLGIALGLLLALIHACWAALVALAWAQPLMDFIFRLHFISPPWHIESFAWSEAFLLVGITFLSGFVIGEAGGWLWNRFGASK